MQLHAAVFGTAWERTIAGQRDCSQPLQSILGRISSALAWRYALKRDRGQGQTAAVEKDVTSRCVCLALPLHTRLRDKSREDSSLLCTRRNYANIYTGCSARYVQYICEFTACMTMCASELRWGPPRAELGIMQAK